jgi:hypothetical protein
MLDEQIDLTAVLSDQYLSRLAAQFADGSTGPFGFQISGGFSYTGMAFSLSPGATFQVTGSVRPPDVPDARVRVAVCEASAVRNLASQCGLDVAATEIALLIHPRYMATVVQQQASARSTIGELRECNVEVGPGDDAKRTVALTLTGRADVKIGFVSAQAGLSAVVTLDVASGIPRVRVDSFQLMPFPPFAQLNTVAQAIVDPVNEDFERLVTSSTTEITSVGRAQTPGADGCLALGLRLAEA